MQIGHRSTICKFAIQLAVYTHQCSSHFTVYATTVDWILQHLGSDMSPSGALIKHIHEVEDATSVLLIYLSLLFSSTPRLLTMQLLSYLIDNIFLFSTLIMDFRKHLFMRIGRN